MVTAVAPRPVRMCTSRRASVPALPGACGDSCPSLRGPFVCLVFPVLFSVFLRLCLTLWSYKWDLSAFWPLLRASSSMTEGNQADNGISVRDRKARTLSRPVGLHNHAVLCAFQMAKTNEGFCPLQQCWGQTETTKQQPGDKDVSRSLPEGQSPQVCTPPCTLAHRVPGSNSALHLPLVSC